MAKDAPQSITDILKDVSKRFDVKIGSMSDVVDDVVGLSTGNLAIDHITGVGGLPLGRITELYGHPSSGKTTTGLQTAAALQRKILADGSDDRILYLDFEHSMDGDYAASLGLDVEHPSFLLVQPHWLEQGAQVGLQLIGTGKVRLSIWDSVAEMTPKALMEGEFDQRTAAMNRARLMNGLLQRLNSLLHEQNCAGVFLNHLMESVEMGGRPGMPPAETTPGGKGLKFYASLRMSYKQMKNIKGKALDALSGAVIDQVLATHVKVKVTKNKIADPFREAEVRVRFGYGFDDFWSAVQVLTAHKKVVAGAGGFYYFDAKNVPGLVHDDMARSSTGRPNLRGEPALLAFADERPDWRSRVIGEARDVVAAFGDQAVFAAEETDPWAGGELADLMDSA